MLITLTFQFLVGHALADFVLQTEVMAKYKNWNNPSPTPVGQAQMPCWLYWLSAHSLIHGGVVMLITGYPLLGIAEALLHGVIDYMKCDSVINLHVDQALHILCKVAWILILLYP